MSQPGYSRRLGDGEPVRRIGAVDAPPRHRRRGRPADETAPVAGSAPRTSDAGQEVLDRERGRATIDPNHTPAVEGDHYLTATTPGQRQAVETIIEDAQHDILRRAHPPTVITEEDAAALAERLPAAGGGARSSTTACSPSWSAAQRDVFTAACADQLSGLHGPAGQAMPGTALGLPALPAGGVRARGTRRTCCG